MAIIVTSPVPPLQVIAAVTVAEVTIIAAGSVTSIVLVTGPQLLASVTLYGSAVPANTPVKILDPSIFPAPKSPESGDKTE